MDKIEVKLQFCPKYYYVVVNKYNTIDIVCYNHYMRTFFY